MKVCVTCKIEKSSTEFYAGNQVQCKICTLARKRRTYAERKAGTVKTITVESAVCPDCKESKPARAFGVDHARPTGIKLYCKPCSHNRTRASRYQIGFDDYEKMVEKQAGCCAVCSEPAKLVVDHDHADGRVRGLLCDDCNKALGFFGDDVERVLAAAHYLMQGSDVLGAIP